MGLPGAEVFERAGLKAWPGVEVDWDGGWVRRAAQGYTKRANSVQSLDPADGENAEARIVAAARWFAQRGLRPVFRVTPLAGPQITAALDALGWQIHDHSHQFAMALNPLEPDMRCRGYEVADPAFLTSVQHLQAYGETQMAGLRALLGALTVPARGFVLRDADGAPVASSIMCVADGIVVTSNVVTDATRRRQGFGAAMMRTGLAWAHGAGARVAALNVQADNGPGKALYQSLGYQRQYDYSYRMPEAQ